MGTARSEGAGARGREGGMGTRREAWGVGVVPPPPGQGGRPSRVVDADVLRRVVENEVRHSLGPEVGTPPGSRTLKTRALQTYANVPSDSPEGRPAVTCFTTKNLGGGTRTSVITRSGHGAQAECSAQADASRWEAICAAEQGTGLSRRRLEGLWAEFKALAGRSEAALSAARAENVEGILFAARMHAGREQRDAAYGRWKTIVNAWFSGCDASPPRGSMTFEEAVAIYVRQGARQNAWRCRRLLLALGVDMAGGRLAHAQIVTQMRLAATAQRKTALLRELRRLPDRVFGACGGGGGRENGAVAPTHMSAEEFCERAALTCVALIAKLTHLLGLELEHGLSDGQMEVDTDAETTPERASPSPPIKAASHGIGTPHTQSVPRSAARESPLRPFCFHHTPSPTAVPGVQRKVASAEKEKENAGTPASAKWRRVKEVLGSRTPVRRGAALLADVRVLRGKIWRV